MRCLAIFHSDYFMELTDFVHCDIHNDSVTNNCYCQPSIFLLYFFWSCHLPSFEKLYPNACSLVKYVNSWSKLWLCDPGLVYQNHLSPLATLIGPEKDKCLKLGLTEKFYVWLVTTPQITSSLPTILTTTIITAKWRKTVWSKREYGQCVGRGRA